MNLAMSLRDCAPVDFHRSERTTFHRLPKRGSHDASVIYPILDAAFLAHVGFQVDGQPYVIPTLYGRAGDKLYLHGSAASRLLRHLDSGVPMCINVALVDGLVLARSAFHHSMNYRSVVVFGTARKIEDREKKIEALRVISEHLIAGRWQQVRQPNEKELKATTVLEIMIEESSAKVRTGPPADDEEDYALPVWAGILPLQVSPSEAVPDERLNEGTQLPEYVRQYGR